MSMRFAAMPENAVLYSVDPHTSSVPPTCIASARPFNCIIPVPNTDRSPSPQMTAPDAVSVSIDAIVPETSWLLDPSGQRTAGTSPRAPPASLATLIVAPESVSVFETG